MKRLRSGAFNLNPFQNEGKSVFFTQVDPWSQAEDYDPDRWLERDIATVIRRQTLCVWFGVA
jgi:hypothetical protein